MAEEQKSPYTAEDFKKDAEKLINLMNARVKEIDDSFQQAQKDFNDQKDRVQKLETEIGEQSKQIKKNQEELTQLQGDLKKIMQENIALYEKKEGQN